MPLTVSPFVSLPAATTLSYNYKTMPSNIPPSALGVASDAAGQQAKPKFVVSGSGHAAHPDDIMESCRALLAHVTDLERNAERDLHDFEESIKQRDLAEKRRVAPGWLDSESRLLQPEKMSSPPASEEHMAKGKQPEQVAPAPDDDEGAQLDKAFGGMGLR